MRLPSWRLFNIGMEKKERFFKVYANLPLNLREEVILVIKDEPISWRVAYFEISDDTKL